MSDRDASVVVSAFTEDQVERLTGVTKRQLRYWDRTGFFAPSLAFEDRSQPFSRLYSFRDVVSLKVLNALRNDGHVPLPQLREVRNASCTSVKSCGRRRHSLFSIGE
jgi:DNA-binding transcriptional MerR regulator